MMTDFPAKIWKTFLLFVVRLLKLDKFSGKSILVAYATRRRKEFQLDPIFEENEPKISYNMQHIEWSTWFAISRTINIFEIG